MSSMPDCPYLKASLPAGYALRSRDNEVLLAVTLLKATDATSTLSSSTVVSEGILLHFRLCKYC